MFEWQKCLGFGGRQLDKIIYSKNSISCKLFHELTVDKVANRFGIIASLFTWRLYWLQAYVVDRRRMGL